MRSRPRVAFGALHSFVCYLTGRLRGRNRHGHPALRYLIGLIAMAGLVPALETHAMGRLLHSTEDNFFRCRVDRVEAKFSGDANYRVWGTCYEFASLNTVKDPTYNPKPESTFGNEKLIGTVNWEAQGKYQPEKKIAEETISILKRESPRADRTSHTIAGRINATMSCEQDPWLAVPKGGCQVKYMGGDNVGRAWQKQLYGISQPVPASSTLPAERRAELKDQHQRSLAYRNKFAPGAANTTLQKSGIDKSRVDVSQAPKAMAVFPTGPTIDAPRGILTKGRGVFKITPSKHLTGSHALIQLRWLNPTASAQGEGLDKYQFEAPLSQIASINGMPAPDSFLAPGIWEMRVRINQPKAGDWSDPVRFQVIQNPAASAPPNARTRTEAQSKGAAPASSLPPSHSVPAPPKKTAETANPPATSGAAGRPLNLPQSFEGRR